MKSFQSNIAWILIYSLINSSLISVSAWADDPATPVQQQAVPVQQAATTSSPSQPPGAAASAGLAQVDLVQLDDGRAFPVDQVTAVISGAPQAQIVSKLASDPVLAKAFFNNQKINQALAAQNVTPDMVTAAIQSSQGPTPASAAPQGAVSVPGPQNPAAPPVVSTALPPTGPLPAGDACTPYGFDRMDPTLLQQQLDNATLDHYGNWLTSTPWHAAALGAGVGAAVGLFGGIFGAFIGGIIGGIAGFLGWSVDSAVKGHSDTQSDQAKYTGDSIAISCMKAQVEKNKISGNYSGAVPAYMPPGSTTNVIPPLAPIQPSSPVPGVNTQTGNGS